MVVAASPQLVGRDEEVGRLEQFLEGAAEGSASMLIEGDPGIGKTTLWRAGLARAQELGFRVLQARPAAAERELSFAALGDLLLGAHDQIGALPAPQRRALRISLALSEANGKPPEPRTLALAVLGLLRVLAEEEPVVVALDDVQWLDAPSASVLQFAVRRLDHEPVRVLATCRPGAESMMSLGDGEQLTLGPLSLDAIDRLVRDRLGAQFLRPTLRQLEQASGGNPFYVLEIAAGLLNAGRQLAPGDPLPVPVSLRDAVRAHLAELKPAAREAALITAALAQPTVTVLEEALGARWAGVREAVAAAILEEVDGTLRFTHPLFASTVYEEAGPKNRREVHRRLSKIVKGAEERARHLAEASEGPDEQVASALEVAASNLAARAALDRAARLAKQAVDLTPQDRRSERHRRQLDWARYSAQAGDPAFAEKVLQRQLETAEPGHRRSEVLLELGKIHILGKGITGTRSYYERALEELERADELELRTRILIELAELDIGETRKDSEASKRALASAERLGDAALLARALGTHGYWLTRVVGRPPSDDYWRRAIEVEERSGELHIGGPTHAYSYVTYMGGDLDTSAELVRRVMASLTRTGDPMVADLLMEACEHEREAGNWHAAARHAEAAHELVLQTGREQLEPACLLLKARLNIRLGDLDLARGQAEEAIDLTNRSQKSESGRAFIEMTAKAVLGQVAAECGDYATAHERLSAAIEAARQLGAVGDAFAAQVRSLDVECLVALGRLEEAKQQLERLMTVAETLAVPWLDAIAARTHGLVRAAEGDSAAALGYLDHAVQTMEAARTPSPFELARTLLMLGQLQRRGRQKLAARRMLERALDIFDGLGARLWAEETRAELRQIGGRPARAGPLTDTEQRIASLVAAGRSNAEVAHELFISPKTVEWNLSKIYKKLHVRSRAELAARFVKQSNNH